MDIGAAIYHGTGLVILAVTVVVVGFFVTLLLKQLKK